jgi:hypothetical protein
MPQQLVGGAASFTDDTSLPFAPFVSIHAQVVAEGCDLGWFRLLRDLCGSAAGTEFKKAAIDAFFSQSIFVQLIWLRSIGYQVRIHITDPRPHVAGMGGFLRKVLPKGTDLITFIKKLEATTAHLAAVRDLLNDYIAETLLRHAPAQQYLMTHRALEYASGTRINPYLVPDDCGIHIEKPEPLPVDIEPFRKRKANVIGGVSDFVSASASVFTPATDELTGDGDLAASPLPARRWGAASTLCQSHAFDGGDEKQMAWMEDQRAGVLDRTRAPFYFVAPEPLIEVDSASSEHIQAADIAAGIARELWYRWNLVQVVRHFVYVTYNAERLSVDKAASIQRLIDEEL